NNGEGRDNRNFNRNNGEGRDNRNFNRNNGEGGNRSFGNKDRDRKPMLGGDTPIATKETRSDKGNRHDINREYSREKNNNNNDGNRGGRNNRKNNARNNDFNNNGPARKQKNGKKSAPVMPPKKEEPKEDVIRNIILPDPVSLKDLADACKIAPAVIIKKLFLGGQMVTINTEFSFEEASEIALEYNCIAEEEVKVDVIEELLKEEEEDESRMTKRPPVICVMGHVDHGKTSLLDRIRSTQVTAGEAGGITQHIGAYVVDLDGEKITFLDTPGHEAFTSMRLRGAQATDIAVLVVAADDGVMPQTVEAINHAKAAEVEVIVAVNKIDKEGANVDRVKQELTEYGLVAEDWGGDTVFVPVSAKTGEGIEDLLEMITLTAEVLELKANAKRQARGLVIEAKLDKGRGPVATILIQKGTLHVGDTISIGHTFGRVRAMIDDKGGRLKAAGPSVPVEILGLNDVPFSGEVMIAHGNEKEARAYAEEFIAYGREKMLEETKSKVSLDDLFNQIQAGNMKELNIIVKADVQGSVEAVKQSLVRLSNEEVAIKVIHGAVGAINESDVTLASASNAIIIGFNVRPDALAKNLAESEKVDMRLYRVIYNAIEDIEAAMKGMLDPVFAEKVIGHLEVRQIYKASGVGTIAGCYVLDGNVTKASQVRIVRDGIVIYEGTLASLKRFKDDVKEVKAGFECGLVFEKYNDVKEGDQVEAFIMEEIPR
ncbi:MAG: translation initiation factor IF-2, partial [Eubacteriales bacterium]|nr:translation initiation factor IF-2 [Eubacteriales bacterium]